MNRLSIPQLSDNICRFCDRMAISAALGHGVPLPQEDEEHIELSLDIGLAVAWDKDMPDKCRMTDAFVIASFDLTGDVFRFILTDMGGRILSNTDISYDGRYFFDENVCFLFKDTSRMYKKHFNNYTLIGCTVIVPEYSGDFVGTKIILADRERLCSLVERSFGCSNIFFGDSLESLDKLTEWFPTDKETVLAVSRSGNNTVATVCDGRLWGSRRFSKIRVQAQRGGYVEAEELAEALYNTVSVLAPTSIFFDDISPFFFSNYTDNFNEALLALSPKGAPVPKIMLSQERFSLLGPAGILRRGFIRKWVTDYLKSEKGRKLWNTIH